MRIGNKILFALAVFLMLAVLVICVSPVANLPATALRSQQQALLTALAIVASAMILSGIQLPPPTLAVLLPRNRDRLPDQRLAHDVALPILC
jgi:hypothetical protein